MEQIQTVEWQKWISRVIFRVNPMNKCNAKRPTKPSEFRPRINLDSIELFCSGAYNSWLIYKIHLIFWKFQFSAFTLAFMIVEFWLILDLASKLITSICRLFKNLRNFKFKKFKLRACNGLIKIISILRMAMNSETWNTDPNLSAHKMTTKFSSSSNKKRFNIWAPSTSRNFGCKQKKNMPRNFWW